MVSFFMLNGNGLSLLFSKPGSMVFIPVDLQGYCRGEGRKIPDH